ncbi:MAG: PAS domain S-box protein [Alphaproteobacteria bacterium]|nr:PAS domain S-box protein [Alphaproteobacteria bacterium]
MPDATLAPPLKALAAAFDAAPSALAVFDTDGRILHANPVFHALVGPQLAASLAAAARAAVDPLTRGEDCPATALVAGPPEGVGLEARWSAIRAPSGRVTSVCCAVHDMSRAVAAESALRASDDRFRTFMKNSPLSTWIVDREGRYVYASPGYERHFASLAPGAARTIRNAFPADLAEEYLRNNAEVLASGERREAIENGLRPDGVQGKFFVVKFPVRATDGDTLVGGIALDVTEMLAAERSALDSELRFGAIFDNAAVGIAQVSTDGVLVRVNRRLAEIVGHPAEDLLGRTFTDITHPDDIAANLAVSQQVRDGLIDEFAMEKRYIRKDGSIVWATLNVRCVREASGAIAYFVSVIEDISARKQAQDRIELLIAEVNHRAKNMLAVVQAIARQTARGADPATFVDRFSRRVQSLAAAQDLFIASGWGPVSMRTVIASQLAPFGEIDGARIALSGPDVDIKTAPAQSIAMAVHELAATASANGALSTPDGCVAIAWEIGADGRLTLSWRERGGPPPARTDAPPAPRESAGYGTKVILDMVRLSLRADVSAGYEPDGFAWTLSAPRDVIAPAPEATP